MTNKFMFSAFLALFTIHTTVAQDVSRDIELGKEGYEQVVTTMGLYEFEAVDTLLDKLGERLVKQIDQPLFNYDFYLVDSPEPNAFALPGGKIFVTRGLLILPLNEDELAGVIGHEIIHSQNRHSVKQQRNGIWGAIVSLPGAIIGGIFRGPVGQAVASPFLAGGQLISAQYSQGNEKEADKEGIALAAKAGYAPFDLALLLSRLSKEAELLTGEAEEKSYFASHPYTPKRVKNIQKTSDNLTQSDLPHFTTDKQFLSLLDGLLVSANPYNGFVDSDVLYSPKHGFEINVPKGWQSAATPTSLGLMSDESDAVISFLFEKDTLKARDFINEMKKAMQQQTGSGPDKSENFSWFGMKGAMLEYSATEQGQEIILQIYALDNKDGDILKIASFFVEGKRTLIEETFKSAKPEKAADMPAAEVLVIKSVKPFKGQTLQALAKEYNCDEQMPAIILINELPSAHKFKGDEVVKLLVPEKLRF